MRPKYARRNMYTTFSNNGTNEIDISVNRMSSFNVTKPLRYYQVAGHEDQRPDMICNNIYGTIDYWWILVQFNDIVDVFTELKEGMILKVPDIKDISEFINKVRADVSLEQADSDKRTSGGI
jgi:hypothetical protein